jgi:hypothetical protein
VFTALRAPDASLRHTLALILALLLLPVPASATTAPDLRGRIVVDGNTSDWAMDESVFGDNGTQISHEPANDSRWSPNDELTGFRVTWDRRALYIACEGVIWGNNMALLVDIISDAGLSEMTGLSSWQRHIAFSADFTPDLFLATWDGNMAPRLLRQAAGNLMNDQPPGADFEAASTFSAGNTGRAMEARIPWSQIVRYRAPGWVVERDTTLAGQPDTLYFLPPGTTLRLALVLTGGQDGSGGPDVAPNNSTGCSDQLNVLLTVDNFAVVPLDADNDGLPDVGASPLTRATFKNTALPVHRSTWGALTSLAR